MGKSLVEAARYRACASRISNPKSEIANWTVRTCAVLSAIAMLAQTPPPSIQFTDVTKNAGITFTHYTGAFGKKYLPDG